MKRLKRTVATSAMPMGMPGCPEFAFCTASIASARMAFAMSRSETARAGASLIAAWLMGFSSRHAALAFDELQDERRQNELHCKIELVAWHDDGVCPRHERVVEHRK